MAISMTDVKTLRDETGVSIMQCKKALEEAGGDIDKAKVLLRKISAQVADKKGDRSLGSGTVGVYLHQGGNVAGVVVLSCETDFVAKNEEFKALAYDIAMHVAAMAPEFVTRDEVKDEDVAAAKAVFAEEVADKPAEMQEQILEGKLSAYLKEKVLVEQLYVKDGEKTVGQLITEATQKFGERVEITRSERFSA
jgi:elongation factor Ts